MALQPASPKSQKNRPIAFVLEDQTTPGAELQALTLVIRPEELVRNYPSRMQAHYTAGGAFADNFGPGISTINLSGTTGWRRVAGDNTADRDGVAGLDGEGRFRRLYEVAFADWHKRRADAVRAGRDPSGVRLVLADALDDFAVVVAPGAFTLRRSKQRPLLMQFQISLTVLSETTDPRPAAQPVSQTQATKAGLESLAASVDRITARIGEVQTAIDKTLGAPVRTFMEQSATLYRSVEGAVRAVDGVAGSLIGVAQTSAQAGMLLFRSLGAVAYLPTRVRALLGLVGASYSNVWCVLSNTLQQRALYEDYTPLYGASNCSSTSGGRPISGLGGVNTFEAIAGGAAARPQPVQMDAGARAALAALAQSDPVLAPLNTATMARLVGDLNAGLRIL